jgi:type IV secretory pathway TrbF-like protein
MSINVETEDLIPFSEARTAFPGGRRLSLQTLHRWRLSGVRGVRLETCVVGGLRYVSRESIFRFIAAQNASESPAPAITAKQRRTQAESANRVLQEAGI